MRRLVLGIVILAVLLAGSLTVCVAMERIHRPIARSFALAAERASLQDRDGALAQIRKADLRWEKYRRFTAAFADHTPMDEIDALLEELAVYAKAGEEPHFSATCVRLAVLTAAMAESHLLSWWNLL